MFVKQNNIVNVNGVDLFRWAPNQPIPHLRPHRLFYWTRNLPLAPQLLNFGDLLSENIVSSLAPQKTQKEKTGSPRLLAIGSILHFIQDGDTIWGSGLRGLHDSELKLRKNIKFEAVRGPLTREKLMSTGQYDVPEVYGDPGILTPLVFPKNSLHTPTQDRKIALLPNLNEFQEWANLAKNFGEDYKIISPMDYPQKVLKEIVNSKAIITSSLHGFIMAEAYQIPRSLVMSSVEPRFKYDDYYEGTGRTSLKIHDNIKSASDSFDESILDFDNRLLVEKFPTYLWERTNK